MLKLILANKRAIGSILAVLATIGTLLSLHASFVESYRNEVSQTVETRIQKQYNEQLSKQLSLHQEKINKAVEKYKAELENAERKRDKYWQSFYAQKEQDLIRQYETKMQGQGIKDESNKINDDNTISDDTVRLLNKARAIINKPATDTGH